MFVRHDARLSEPCIDRDAASAEKKEMIYSYVLQSASSLGLQIHRDSAERASKLITKERDCKVRLS
jgi:hypothetical protein